MTEHWQPYMTWVSDFPVSIIFNLGIAEQIDLIEADTLYVMILDLKEATEDGFPTDEAMEQLNAFDDELSDHIDAQEDVYFVGRALGNSQARFYMYLKSSDDTLLDGFRQIAARHEMKLEEKIEEDKARHAYWDFLFPNDVEWRVIADRMLLEHLEENGDTLEPVRQVDHFAYFTTPDDRDQFKSWAMEHEFSITREFTPENDEEADDDLDEEHPFGLEFRHDISLVPPGIHELSVMLHQQALDMNGKYDGWETQLVATGSDENG